VSDLSLPLKILLIAPPFLLAVILHEIAHGLVAYRLGDDTAARAGRLTLNPLSHVDPMGSVALPLLLLAVGSPYVFGWAKPVPVNFGRLPNPQRDMVKVAVAGPATNVVLAIAFAAAAHVCHGLGWPLPTYMMSYGVVINIVLAVFNLIPILPLDGGRVLFGLLPREPALAFARLEPYGMFIVMGLLFTGALNAVLSPITTMLLRVLL